MADASAVGAATISLGQVVSAYQFFLPKISEVRRANKDDPSMRADVAVGQFAAGAMTVAVGVLLSSMTGSKLPLWTALFIAAIIGGVYQYAMYGQEGD